MINTAKASGTKGEKRNKRKQHQKTNRSKSFAAFFYWKQDTLFFIFDLRFWQFVAFDDSQSRRKVVIVRRKFWQFVAFDDSQRSTISSRCERTSSTVTISHHSPTNSIKFPVSG